MMIDAVGGFFGRRKDCIVVEGCVCEGDLFFLVHVSVTLLIRCFAPLMHDDYVDIVVEGSVLAVNVLFFSLEDNCS